MPDSRLNEAEQGVQPPLRKSHIFNGLLMAIAVAAVHLQLRLLPTLAVAPPATTALAYRPVELASGHGPLRLVGAWEASAADKRFGGISSLTVDRHRFLSISDRGAVVRFDLPWAPRPQAWVADLVQGPGSWGRKWSRDAESLAPDPQGRGWWIGYEQNHSLWLYDDQFAHALTSVDLERDDWWNNRGAEGLIQDGGELLVTAENGREAMLVGQVGIRRLALDGGADVAEASRGPDGSAWVLLRSKSLSGIRQSIAPLVRTGTGYRAGPAMPVPKGRFDNYEGMAIESRPGGGLRFWLISDDGHRVMARTLLVALDLDAGHGKGPTPGAEPLQNSNGSQP